MNWRSRKTLKALVMKGMASAGQLLSQATGPTRWSQETVRKFGTMVTVSGTISVARTTTKIASRPGNRMRARG